MPERTTDERLAVIEDTLTRMEKRLFGNGQPGVVQSHDQRLDRLESFVWRAIGAIGLLMATGGLYAAFKG